MAVSNLLEKLGRAIFESPFGSPQGGGDTPELAEIRLALLDEVKSRTHRVSGREVFPYNEVKLALRGVPSEQSGVFAGTFFAQFCTDELRAGLVKARIRHPEDLEVLVETSSELPQSGEQWFTVETTSRTPAPVVGTGKSTARLVVAKGHANAADVKLTKTRTNIGRTTDVYRSDGPSRRNDLAFEESDEISRTVSREHAHVLFSKKTGEYRLYNDRSYNPSAKNAVCGLWIIRDGLSYEVHRGTRGTKLEPGDEIHLGRAVLKFVRKP